MNYTELSLNRLREVSIEAAWKIKQIENIDLIVYVAKAGFPIAIYMNEVLQCGIIGIDAKRKGNGIKSVLGAIVSYMPRFIRDILITIEIKSNVHKQDTERNICFHESVDRISRSNVKSILIVDDSVDTGNSIRAVVEAVKEVFPRADTKIYSLNVWEQSKALVSVDYMTYVDTVIRAPMSKDSREYKNFCKLYDRETKDGYI